MRHGRCAKLPGEAVLSRNPPQRPGRDPDTTGPSYYYLMGSLIRQEGFRFSLTPRKRRPSWTPPSEVSLGVRGTRIPEGIHGSATLKQSSEGGVKLGRFCADSKQATATLSNVVINVADGRLLPVPAENKEQISAVLSSKAHEATPRKSDTSSTCAQNGPSPQLTLPDWTTGKR